jgi:hypothetical protein
VKVSVLTKLAHLVYAGEAWCRYHDCDGDARNSSRWGNWGGWRNPNNDDSNNDNDNDNNDEAPFLTFPQDPEIRRINRLIWAHGITMAVAFAVLFPIGATLVKLFRFKGVVWFHSGWQLFTFAVAIAAWAIGIYAKDRNYNEPVYYHTNIGHVVMGALVLQPILGLVHHFIFRKRRQHERSPRMTKVGIAHRWWGRFFVVLGIINGGLGLHWARERDGWKIAYGIIAGIFGVYWILVVMISHLQGRKRESTTRPAERKKSFDSGSDVSMGRDRNVAPVDPPRYG